MLREPFTTLMAFKIVPGSGLSSSARARISPGPLTLVLSVITPLLVGLRPVSSAEPARTGDEPLWNAVWLTDTECHWQGCGDKMPPLLNKVAANKPKMVIHTGDTSFEWANRGSWKEVLDLLRIETPPIEFHLAPGNHDDEPSRAVRPWLAKAASRGIYPIDTGEKVPGKGYYKDRKIEEVSGPQWPIWNPEVAVHPNWQPDGGFPGRYVFKRGNIRFIVLDFYHRESWRKWLAGYIREPDDSSATIILQHKDRDHFPGHDDGPHNVRLVLSGHLQGFKRSGDGETAYIRTAGIGNRDGENDAMTLWVYKNHLRLDRYFIPAGSKTNAVEGPVTVWTCKGEFSEYRRPGRHVERVTGPSAEFAITVNGTADHRRMGGITEGWAGGRMTPGRTTTRPAG